MASVRIVIVDDHPIFRDGLRRLLAAEAGFEVIGEAGDAASALQMVRDLAPEVLLLDLALPDSTGLEVLRRLQEWGSPTRTVMLTASIERDQVLQALLFGARGLVLKESATALLFRCIRAVLAGEYWLGHDRTHDLVQALRDYGQPLKPSPADTLTPRELRIIAAVVDGATNRDIAEQLAISEQTVKNHMSTIFDKVGVSNRLELALYAIHHKLLERGLERGGERRGRVPAAPLAAAQNPSVAVPPPRAREGRGGSSTGD
jgi:two-component system nitrate/nitrite response regulator NarL